MCKCKYRLSNLLLLGQLLLTACFMFHVDSALAIASGRCERDVPYNFDFNYSPTLTSPDQNKAGLVFPSAYNWNLNGNYTAVCDTYSSGPSFYFKGDANNASPGHAANWFILNNNIEFQVKIGVYNDYSWESELNTVPFKDVANHVSHGVIHDQETSFTTGSQGSVSLYFRRPFVGQMTIPPTIISRLYGSTSIGFYGPNPMSTVTMSGTITVPQSCNINEGDVINVDFGNIDAYKFITKGQPPTGFTKKRVDFDIKCSNISNGVAVTLEFNGTTDANDSTAVKTDNSDIAIRLADTSNNTISPQGGEIPVNFNYANQTGTSAMQLYPINTTGNVPATGKFNSQVNVTVDIQ